MLEVLLIKLFIRKHESDVIVVQVVAIETGTGRQTKNKI